MRVAAAAAAVLVVALATPASAHGVAAHGAAAHDWTAPGAFSVWDLGVLGILLLTGALYVRGSQGIAARGGTHPLRERVAFASGWSVLVLSIMPPLDSLAIQLFSVHMIQHELMILIGAPLLIAGRPLTPVLWGLPAQARLRAARALQAPASGATWRVLTSPVAAWSVHGLATWVWHMPVLYDAAVNSEGIHALQHGVFVASSALFWWGLLYGRYGRAGYGAAVFFVFTTAVHTGILGAMLTFAGTPLYPVYAGPAAARGIDPLGDQQVAGLLMWIPAGIILTVVGVALFAAWMGESERRDNAAAPSLDDLTGAQMPGGATR